MRLGCCSLIVAASLAQGIGCGSDASPDNAPDGGAVDECPAPVADPAEAVPGFAAFPTAGCEPGSLDGFELGGVWYVEPVDGVGRGPVRFTDKCGTLFATDDRFAQHTADHLYWGVVYEGSTFVSGVAYRACRVEPDGALWGYVGVVRGPDTVEFSEFVARPFGWIEGETEADGVELVSRWAGSADAPWASFTGRNVRVHGTVAYMITVEGLRIVDVSDPAAPFDLGFLPSLTDVYNDVKIVEHEGRVYAILASNYNGVVIADVTAPGAPVEVRRFSPSSASSGIHTVFAQSVDGAPWAYFVDGISAELTVFDLRDPTVPAAVVRYDGGRDGFDGWAGFHDLYVEGDRAYINATDGGFAVLDLSIPGAPSLVGRAPLEDSYSHSNWVTTVGDRRVAVHGGEGHGSYLRVLDVDEQSASFLETVGEFRLRETVSIHNIMAVGDRAYVAYYQNGLRVIDLSDVTQPAQIGYFNTWDPEVARGTFYEGAIGIDVDVDRGLIYVADTESGLLILRETR